MAQIEEENGDHRSHTGQEEDVGGRLDVGIPELTTLEGPEQQARTRETMGYIVGRGQPHTSAPQKPTRVITAWGHKPNGNWLLLSPQNDLGPVLGPGVYELTPPSKTTTPPGRYYYHHDSQMRSWS